MVNDKQFLAYSSTIKLIKRKFKKMKKSKISILLTRKIKVGALVEAAGTMNLAIWGNLLVFTGTILLHKPRLKL